MMNIIGIIVLAIIVWKVYIWIIGLTSNQELKEQIAKRDQIKQKINQGDKQALLELGLHYKETSSYYLAVDWLRKAVKENVDGAQIELDFCEQKIKEREQKFVDDCLKKDIKNYVLIKKCCVELANNGYKIHYGSVSVYDAYISIYEDNDIWIGSIKFGTRGPAHNDSRLQGNSFATKHIENWRIKNNQFKHFIHLDTADILIESNTPWTEAVPEWLIICARLLATGFALSNAICYPEWIEESSVNIQDAKKYVNVAFQNLGVL